MCIYNSTTFLVKSVRIDHHLKRIDNPNNNYYDNCKRYYEY